MISMVAGDLTIIMIDGFNQTRIWARKQPVLNSDWVSETQVLNLGRVIYLDPYAVTNHAHDCLVVALISLWFLLAR